MGDIGKRLRTVLAGLVVALLPCSCAAPHPHHATAAPGTRPGPDPSALVRSIGQGCTWYGGVRVTVASVHRRDRDAPDRQAGYVVAVRVANSTPRTFATGGLSVRLWVGRALRPAVPDDRGALGRGLPDQVVAPRRHLTGTYGFRIARRSAATRVAVGIRPDPVVQQCVLRGTAATDGAS